MDKLTPMIHVINDLPHLYELDDMLGFCRRYKRLYIYGTAENQEYLLKYLDLCGVPVEGYVVSASQSTDQRLLYRELPILPVEDVLSYGGAGIILGLADRYYRHVIPKFRAAGFQDYFVMTEYNKSTIANQLKPRLLDNMSFEVNLADHCNLDCQMCDHYSQLAGEHFLDVAGFERDMEHMGRIFNHRIGCVSLLGGEPTLHPELVRCMEITRRQFPDGQIILLTNGLLLPRLEHGPGGNIFQVCRDLDVNVTVTVYPIPFDYEALQRKAAQYGVALAMSSNVHAQSYTKVVKISDKHTLDLSGEAGKDTFISCLYFNKFNVLKDGRYYMCPVAAHSGIFNRAFGQDLKLADGDSLDVSQVESWEQLARFSCSAVPFCRYCDQRNWHAHGPWARSTKKMDEYVRE